jgi:hypothetical protein
LERLPLKFVRKNASFEDVTVGRFVVNLKVVGDDILPIEPSLVKEVQEENMRQSNFQDVVTF